MNFKKILTLISSLTIVSSSSPVISNFDSKINESSILKDFRNINQHDHFTKINGTKGEILSLAISKNQQKVYAGNDNGSIYVSTLGGNFKKLVNYKDGKISFLVTAPNGKTYSARVLENETIIYQTNNSGGFEQINILPSIVVTMTVDKNSNLYVGSNEGVFLKLSDQDNFEQLAGVDLVQSLVVTTNGLIYAGTIDGKIYKSFGYNFNFVTTLSDWISVMALGVDSKDTVYAVNLNGEVFNSNTNKPEFTKFKKIPLENFNFTTTLTINKIDDSIYVGDSKGAIWKSDSTSDFQKLEGIYGDKFVRLASTNKGRIYAGATDGVYFSN